MESTGRSARVMRVVELWGLAQLLQTGVAYIGNDSGPTHLAAFLQLPTIALFGPSDPGRWAPVGHRVKVIAPHLKCHPCFETDSGDCDSSDCFAGITPQRVIDAFYEIVPGRSG